MCGDVAHDHDVEEDKKVLCQVLGRLHLPETVDDDKIRTLKLLVHNVFTVPLLFHSLRLLTMPLGSSADRSETCPPATPSPNSTRRSARSMPTSWLDSARRNIDDSSSSTRCFAFWTTLCRWTTGRRRSRWGLGGGSGGYSSMSLARADGTWIGDRRA